MTVHDGFGLYAILTNPVVGFDYLTRLLVDCSVRFIQLRMKEAPIDEVRRVALSMRSITEGSDSLFFLNDDPTLAREVGADGVHLGQDDMSYDRARAIVGPDALIGISTHNLTQTRTACALLPAYVGVGPVFPTPTKKMPDPVIGLDGMGAMIAHATVPAVAIGGIDLSNLPQVLKAGARNYWMVRQINASEKPQHVLSEAQRIFNDLRW